MKISIVEDLDKLSVCFYDSRSESAISSVGITPRDYVAESINRSRRSINSIVSNNKFTHFYTQTFSSNSFYSFAVSHGITNFNSDDLTTSQSGRVSFAFVKSAISAIAHYFSYYKIPYILVYDIHKDNTLHIHGLVDLSEYISKGHKRWVNSQNQYLNMRFLGYSTFKNEKLPRCCNRLFLRKFGINSFIQISSSSKRANLSYYLSKYVSKAINRDIVPHGERRYFCSKGLKRYQSIMRDEGYYVKFLYDEINQSHAEYYNKCFENSDIFVFDISQKIYIYWLVSLYQRLYLKETVNCSVCLDNATQLSFL